MTDKKLALAAALLLAAPAAAQEGAPLTAALSDGRSAQVGPLSETLYRIDVDGAGGFAEGAPLSLHVGDVDGDGMEDVVVLMARGEGPDGRQPAHVWDVTTERPYLMHVTTDISLPQNPLGSLEWDIARRFSTRNGLEELEQLREEVADGVLEAQERDMVAPNILATLEGVMRRQAVAEARAAHHAAPSEETHMALDLALQEREEFARERSGRLLRDAIRD